MTATVAVGAARAPQSLDFEEALVLQFRRTPWFVMSAAIHAALILVLHLFGSETAPPVARAEPMVATLDAAVPPEAPPPAPDDAPEVAPVIEPLEDDVVVVRDVELSDKEETANDDPRETARGEADALSDKPFDAEGHNGAIGLGGPAGNAFGTDGGGLRDRTRKRSCRPPGLRNATELGLDWLARHQSRDGGWDCDGFPAMSDPKRGPPADGKGQPQYDVGVSGLALLAFLGAGNTHREGPFKETVRSGLKWLANQQDSDGCFGPRGHHYTYNHGIATLAMAEAWGMTGTAVWKAPAQKGIDFVVKAQNPYKAWRYDVTPGDNDVSVTGWMCMALKSAKLAGGLTVPDEPLKNAHAFVKELTDEETGRTGYAKKGERPVRPEGKDATFPAEESEALTAAGMLVRIFGGENPKDSPMLKAGAELLLKRLPVWEKDSGKIDMYYWYYGTLAMFQMGGAEWNQWNAKMVDAIVKTQRTDGNFAGSWDNVDAWGDDGGRVYATAVMTMCLQVYYRYDRVFGAK